jgi:hypothetical protein
MPTLTGGRHFVVKVRLAEAELNGLLRYPSPISIDGGDGSEACEDFPYVFEIGINDSSGTC